MPGRSIHHKVASLNSGEIFFMECGNQIIKTVTVLCFNGSSFPTDCYAEIYVGSGSFHPKTRVATLDSGYISEDHGLKWTGSIPTEPSTYIGVQIWAPAGAIISLGSYLWKIITHDDGGFRVDP
jgi:hypothetical protein